MNTTAHPLQPVTEDTFESEVIAASHNRTVVVDFSAEWCGPCRVLTPVLAGLTVEPGLNATLVTVDADTEPGLLERFGIRSLPTLLFFGGGQLVDRLVGLTSLQTIRAKIAAASALVA